MKTINPKKIISVLPDKAQKYLNKFGAIERNVILSNDKRFEMIVVIPVLAEYENIWKLLNSLVNTDPEFHEKFLILFVVNNSESASEEIKKENLRTFTELKKVIERNSAYEFTNSSRLSFGLIDAFSEGNAPTDKLSGVGFARKVGMDTALCFWDYSSQRKKMLISLDADCTVSNNYFTEIYKRSNDENIFAGYVNFEHPINVEPFSEAIIKYEIFLRYYVMGLKYAESPFAFFTIGSTMLSEWEAYVKIGGMNKRKAAEDFYFMEKLGKNYEVFAVDNVTVYPSPRSSWRVPFGTGRSVEKFLLGNEKFDYLYSPEIFNILKKWNKIFFDKENLTAEYYLGQAKSINPYLFDFLVSRKFPEKWNKITSNNKNQKQIFMQKKYLFDGFETLKLVHFLRDNCCGNVLLYDAVRKILTDYYGFEKRGFYAELKSVLEVLRNIT